MLLSEKGVLLSSRFMNIMEIVFSFWEGQGKII